ncbi:MAG: hypothetical protein L3J33_03200 [Rhodobacteraceae bacterium]|nr:hypothetical protein [Paracoccaceae bacterium]
MKMPEFLSRIIENFNNREIATVIWLFLIFAFLAIFKKDMRRSFSGVFSALFEPGLALILIIFAFYVAALTWLAGEIGVWDSNQIAQTIVWYFIAGLPLLFRAFDAKEGSQHFRGYAKSAISGTVFLEFIYLVKTFSLTIELVLTPIVTVVVLLAAISERDASHSSVNSLMNRLLFVIVAFVLWSSISQIWVEPERFFTSRTFRALILPIYLILGSIPLFYILFCYSRIQAAKRQIDLKTFHSEELKRYAKRRFILTFMLRPWLLRRATRQFCILPAKENKDVDAIISDILQYVREEENPPKVAEDQGWSPHAARDFLSSEGLRTSDFHAGHAKDEWWSGVASKELGDAIFPSLVNYSFYGVKGVVRKLRLKGYFVDQIVTADALDEFSRIATILCEGALSSSVNDLRQRLIARDEFEVTVASTIIQLRSERFFNENGYELFLELERPFGSPPEK